MNQSLPNDADRELAARLGESPALPTAGQDAVVDALRSLKEEYRGQPVEGRSSARIWAQVERATRPGAERAEVHRPVMRLVWGAVSVAAAVLLLVMVPRLLSPASGQLVAEAGAVIADHVTEDGSRVRLRPHSSLYRIDEQTYRLEGEALFEVVSNPDRVFTVRGTVGQVQVLGTTFTVAALDSATTVYLQEGRVRFGVDGNSHVLEPGQLVEARVGGALSRPTATDGTEALDWIRGMLAFESRTAAEVAAELGRHFGIRLELPAGVRTEPLSGSLVLDSQEQALENLGLVLGGRFVETGDGFRFMAR